MRSTAVLAPLFLLTYGILRWIDGWDGDRGGGPAWNIGHVAFFIGMVLFAVLAFQIRATLPTRRTLATIAAAATAFGAACFCWVIIGDLSRWFHDNLPLPGFLNPLGPALFGLGMLTLLGLLVANGRLPRWSPILFLAGYVSISVQLDLLPFAAAMILVAFLPLALNPAPAATRAPSPRTRNRSDH
jgi:hypothetical protein